MKNNIVISSENIGNILNIISAYFAGTKAADYRPSPNDNNLMIERDKNGNVVGIEMLNMDWTQWKHHPDRNIIPDDILLELDRWFKDKTTK